MTRPTELPLVPGLDRGEIHQYEVPELGWSVPYRAEGLAVTVYVYPRAGGRATLAEEFESAKAELIEFSRRRGLEVTVLAKSPGRVDPNRLDASALHGSFLLQGSEQSGEQSRFSEIILMIGADEFVKIRSTYAPGEPKRTGRTINELLAALRSVS